MNITIGHLYPDLLNLYGDKGNIQCLMKRCLWRGVKAEVKAFDLGDKIDFAGLDLILIGGGAGWEQRQVCGRLRSIRSEFRDYIEDQGVLLALCGGYPMLGHYFDTEDGRTEGLSLLDVCTEEKKERSIGNIILENPLFRMPIVGFENHSAQTRIGNNRPLGKVLCGKGNNGNDGTEGVIYKNVIATYLHGPLLPKNPQICDHLISNALKRKYGEAHLLPLNDRKEIEVNQYLYQRFVCG